MELATEQLGGDDAVLFRNARVYRETYGLYSTTKPNDPSTRARIVDSVMALNRRRPCSRRSRTKSTPLRRARWVWTRPSQRRSGTSICGAGLAWATISSIFSTWRRRGPVPSAAGPAQTSGTQHHRSVCQHECPEGSLWSGLNSHESTPGRERQTWNFIYDSNFDSIPTISLP